MSVSKQDQDYLKTLTVLYVEDDEDARKQFTEFLMRPIGTLLTAVNGAEGLEMYRRHKPHIVVTDILMPVMDGLTMVKEIRDLDPSVPVIVLTAFEQTGYLMRAINLGIDKYVTKPVNSYLLFEGLLECAHRLNAEEALRNHSSALSVEAIAPHFEGTARDFDKILHSALGYVTLARSLPGTPDEGRGYLLQAETSLRRLCSPLEGKDSFS